MHTLKQMLIYLHFCIYYYYYVYIHTNSSRETQKSLKAVIIAKDLPDYTVPCGTC